MTIEERILTCRLIEQMEQDKRFASQLGIEDTSTFCNRPVHSSKRTAASAQKTVHEPMGVSHSAD